MRKVKFPIVRKVEGENVWTTYMKRQVYRKNNCINLITTGQTGSAKSWSLLSQFCKIDPDFDVNERCFFHPKHILKYFQSEKITKGTPFLFDEAGVKGSHMNWQDEINKGLNIFLQTSRFRNHIFGLSVPYLTFVSKGIRTLMNCRWKADGYSEKDNRSNIFPYTLEYNGDIDKFYHKRLYYIKDGSLNRCDKLRLPKPPRKIIIEYEKMKKEFTNGEYQRIAERMDMQEQKEDDKITKSRYVKCNQVAKELGITTDALRDWVKKGLVEAKQIGKCYFVTREEYERLLNNPITIETTQKPPLLR